MNHVKYVSVALLVTISAAPLSSAWARDRLPGYDDRLVWANVTRVEPVIRQKSVPPNNQACFQPKPARSAGLSSLLEWDLLVDCSPGTVSETTHYRVHYKWGGQEYDYTSKTLPGNKIRVRVGIAPGVGDW